MGSYIGRRSLHSVFSLIGLIILVFFLARLTGDPTNLFLPIDASVEARQAFAERHGFNDPLITQFGRFLEGLIQGDFGESIRQRRPALEVVLEAFPTTLMLALFSMSIVIASALVIGALAAYRPGGVFDRLSSMLSLSGASAPDFWVAIMAILLFAVALGWLPTSGTGTPWHWVLPVAVLVIRPFGLLVQVVRGAMIIGTLFRLRQNGARQRCARARCYFRACASKRHVAGHHRRWRSGHQHREWRGRC